ncbi:MAG: nicotinamidase-like amidase [Chloroflexi bacterium]|nr:nicotinamidase-like amidase [Chloroflexota bacterium]
MWRALVATLIPAAILATPTPVSAQEWPTIPDPVPVTVDSGTTALLVVDLVSTFCARQEPCANQIPAAARLLGQARQNGLFVVHTGSEPIADVAPLPGEPIVNAPTDKFYDSGLDDLLKERGVKTVVIVGWSANRGVAFTAFAAAIRGYTVAVPVDAAIGATEFDTLVGQYQMLNVTGTPQLAQRTAQRRRRNAHAVGSDQLQLSRARFCVRPP